MPVGLERLGGERCRAAVAHRAAALMDRPDPRCRVGLPGGHVEPHERDAVAAGKTGQKTPEGYYNVERMLKRFATGNHRILLCGTCMDTRGLTDADLVDGAARSSMDALATATVAADKVLVF